jgi:hypothetical protein
MPQWSCWGDHASKRGRHSDRLEQNIAAIDTHFNPHRICIATDAQSKACHDVAVVQPTLHFKDEERECQQLP